MKIYFLLLLASSFLAHASQQSLSLTKEMTHAQIASEELTQHACEYVATLDKIRKKLFSGSITPNQEFINIACKHPELSALLQAAYDDVKRQNAELVAAQKELVRRKTLLSAAVEQTLQFAISENLHKREQEAADKGLYDIKFKIRHERVKQEEESEEKVRALMKAAGSDHFSSDLPPVVTITCHKPEAPTPLKRFPSYVDTSDNQSHIR